MKKKRAKEKGKSVEEGRDDKKILTKKLGGDIKK